MPWQDRIFEAAITTPDGVRYTWDYGDVEREIDMKTSTYIFGNLEGAYLQNFGFGTIRDPLTIFFSGPEHDEEAKEFEKSISLPGVSVLEHPVYGVKNIVPTAIKRRDPRRSAANQTIFILGITETILESTPVSAEETRSIILAKQDAFVTTGAEAFDADYTTVADQLSATDRILAFAKDLKSGFKELLDTVQDIQDTFNDIEDFLTSSIDFLLGAPLLLATTIQRLINTPARIQRSVKNRIDAYGAAYDRILSDPTGSGTDKKNNRQEVQLISMGMLSAMAQVNLFGDFTTKSDAIESANDLRNRFLQGQEFLDLQEQDSLSDNLVNRFNVSDGSVQGIKDIIANTTKNLIRLSFSLKQERIITLEKTRDILTLCFELYGTTKPDTLDFFLDSNALTGSELIEIPIGRDIKYYV